MIRWRTHSDACENFAIFHPHDTRGFSLSGAVAAAEDLYVLSKNTQSAIDSARFRTTGKLEHYFPNILIPFPIMGFDE